jgi:hypothetical protein
VVLLHLERHEYTFLFIVLSEERVIRMRPLACHVCLSVSPHVTTLEPSNPDSCNLTLGEFTELCTYISVSVNRSTVKASLQQDLN